MASINRRARPIYYVARWNLHSTMASINLKYLATFAVMILIYIPLWHLLIEVKGMLKAVVKDIYIPLWHLLIQTNRAIEFV